MTGGRRAADRRRQRGGGHDGDGDGEGEDPGTTPGAAPVVPHDNYVEVDDASRVDGMPLLSADNSAEGLAEASAVLLRERSQSRSRPRPAAAPAAAPAGRQAPSLRGHVVDEEPADADKSFTSSQISDATADGATNAGKVLKTDLLGAAKVDRTVQLVNV